MAQQRQETTRPSAFLFLAGNSALDFVNTRPVLRGHAIELLQDFADLLRWFVAAQLLDPKLAAKFRERWASSPQAHASLRQLLAFRELLRREIAALESSKAVSKKTISGLNRRLAQHPLLAQLVIFHGILRRNTASNRGNLWIYLHRYCMPPPTCSLVLTLFACANARAVSCIFTTPRKTPPAVGAA